MPSNSRSSGSSIALNGLAALCVAVLAVLVLALKHHHAVRFNTALLLGIHQHYAAGATGLAVLISKLAAPEIVGVVAILIAIAAWLGRARTEAIVLAVVAISAAAFTEGLKHLFKEARPHLFPTAVPEHGYSFPSGHTLMSTALFPLLALLFSRNVKSGAARAAIWVVLLLAPLGIGLDRLYLGVHWPTDVVAGWLAGAAFAFAGLAWLLSPARASASRPSATRAK